MGILLAIASGMLPGKPPEDPAKEARIDKAVARARVMIYTPNLSIDVIAMSSTAPKGAGWWPLRRWCAVGQSREALRQGRRTARFNLRLDWWPYGA